MALFYYSERPHECRGSLPVDYCKFTVTTNLSLICQQIFQLNSAIFLHKVSSQGGELEITHGTHGGKTHLTVTRKGSNPKSHGSWASLLQNQPPFIHSARATVKTGVRTSQEHQANLISSFLKPTSGLQNVVDFLGLSHHNYNSEQSDFWRTRWRRNVAYYNDLIKFASHLQRLC